MTRGQSERTQQGWKGGTNSLSHESVGATLDDATILGKESMRDDLNERIGVLTRREVEARLLAPLLEALGEEFGVDPVREVVGKTIIEIARRQGRELAETMGGDSLENFADSLQYWTRNDALEIQVRECSADAFEFDVTRCRYAELYTALGVPELGELLSCNRDFALIEGFNGSMELTRTQTIMQGAPCCDFRYRVASADQEDTSG